MADITLPLPGEDPNWASKLNTAILAINQELEPLGVRVDVMEVGLASVTMQVSSLTGRVTNAEQGISDLDSQVGSLDGRVTSLEDNIEGIVQSIAADIIANDPTIIQAAEDAVQDAVSDLNIVQAYPEEPVQQTSLSQIPLRWMYKSLQDPYTDTYTDTEQGSWVNVGNRWGDVPVLDLAGNIDLAQIPDAIARVSDIPEPTPPANPVVARRIVSPDVPIFAAHLSVARATDTACAVVFAGSSTTAAMPGYVAPLGRLLQEAFPVDNQSAPQQNSSAEFTQRTAAGIHIYNAGQGGTTASDFLTDAECDRIAALNPAMIHVMVGSNDLFMSVDPATYKAQLTSRLAYLDSVITAPVQFVLVQQYERMDSAGKPYDWSEYRQALEEITASRTDTVFCDLSDAYAATGIPAADPLDLISPDNIHQTTRGYTLMTDLLAAFYLAT